MRSLLFRCGDWLLGGVPGDLARQRVLHPGTYLAMMLVVLLTVVHSVMWRGVMRVPRELSRSFHRPLWVWWTTPVFRRDRERLAARKARKERDRDRQELVRQRAAQWEKWGVPR